MENSITPFSCCKVLPHSSPGHATLRLLLLLHGLTEFLRKKFLETLVTKTTNWRSEKHSWRNTQNSEISQQECPDCLLMINNRLNTALSHYNLCPGQNSGCFTEQLIYSTAGKQTNRFLKSLQWTPASQPHSVRTNGRNSQPSYSLSATRSIKQPSTL